MPTLLELIQADEELRGIPGKIKQTAKEIGTGILKGAVDTLGLGGDVVNAGRKLVGSPELPIGSAKLREAGGLGTEDSLIEQAAGFLQPGKIAGAAIGAIATKDFLKAFPEFANTIFKKADGELKEVYHGTSKDAPFISFSKNRRGTFVGEDPAIASGYAKDNDSKNLVYEGGKYVEKNTADRVMPLYVNIQNPYYLAGEELAAYIRTPNYAKSQRDIMDKAKAGGYDAVIYPDGGVAVADPKQLQSSITLKKK